MESDIMKKYIKPNIIVNSNSIDDLILTSGLNTKDKLDWDNSKYDGEIWG